MFVPANISGSSLAEPSPYFEFWHSIYINDCFTSKLWCNTFILKHPTNVRESAVLLAFKICSI